MAVVEFNETWHGETSGGGGLIRTYGRSFKARTDSVNDRSWTVKNYPQCPKKGVNAYPDDPAAVCSDVQIEHLGDGDPFCYEVRVEYSTATPFGSDDPLLEPPDREFNFVTYREVYYKDEDEAVVFNSATGEKGKAVLNSATIPFATAPERDRAYPVFTISMNLASYPLATAIQYAFACNSDPWTFMNYSLAVGQGLALPIRGIQQRRGSSTFWWRVTYEVAMREEGWDDRILDTSRYWLNKNVSPHRLDPILMDNNLPRGADLGNGTTNEPVQDDEILISTGVLKGQPIRREPGFVVSSDHFLSFRPYRRKPFTGVIPA